MTVLDPVIALGLPSDDLLHNSSKSEVLVTETIFEGDHGASSSLSSNAAGDSNPTCIVGMACHLPGGVSSPSDLWELLYNKRSAQSGVPPERFNIDGFYHPDGTKSGVINVRGGYFLQEDVRNFDNNFFGINNLEATYMDPQQRKLLEVVFECFQNAGVSMDEISGSNTGVFIGNFTVDFSAMQTKDSDYLHRYAATGGGTSIMSNRISHVFNLHGPSFTLDTACSSTIYALNQAVTCINNGDCDGAIVAGVNLIMSPEQHIGTMKGGFLSPTSACHTFDVSADGYSRAEAINAIYVTRLSSALDKGHKVRAVIRGIATNSNGRTPGITLPSAEHQAAVIRKAYDNAGLRTIDTDYVECHGTGTPVGDPIEVDAVASCFPARKGAPLMIGSVKTNLGHAEAASGINSIIKVALAFEHGEIPPTYGIKTLNPKLKLDSRNMKVVTENTKWPRGLRRASVNSFGYGGANAHVILESPESYLGTQTPQEANTSSPSSIGKVIALPFSAASESSLQIRHRQISDAIQRLGGTSEAIEGLAHICGTHDSKLSLRDFILASTGPKATLLETGKDEKAVAQTVGSLPVAYVFTGQGAQYAGMAKELLRHNAVFLACIRELDQMLQSLPPGYTPDWTLEQTILDPAEQSQVNDVRRSQPLCTAVQIALVDTLQSWGVTASAVIGHSSGEIAAAYSAGILSASQAIMVAYFRGFAVGQLKSTGAMMAAGVSFETANSMIELKGLKEVRVGCVNSPESVTLSGSESDIGALEDELQTQSKFCRRLQTGGRAYHSHMMAEVGDLYEQLLAPYFDQSSRHATDQGLVRSSMFSSVGVNPKDISSLGQKDMAAYFRENLEQPVQFNAALEKLMASDKYHLVEVGPHTALKGPVQQIRKGLGLDQSTIPYTATLVRNEDADLCLKKAAGTLFRHGHMLNWTNVNGISQPSLADLPDLPAYPWDYSKGLLWHESRASIDARNRAHIRHELLGSRRTVENGIDWTWRNILRPSEIPWLKDHKLETTIVFPGTAYISLAMEAVSQMQGAEFHKGLKKGNATSFECQRINISAPLVLSTEIEPGTEEVELHTIMSQRKISSASSSMYWYDFSVSSWRSGSSMLHCSGSIRVVESTLLGADQGTTTTNAEDYDVWSMGRWYDKCREEGLNFGPAFQSLTSLRTDGSRMRTDSIATTHAVPPSTKESGTFYPLHPITLDACFQAAIMGSTAGNINTFRAFVPVFISQCVIQMPRHDTVSEGLNNDECTIHSHVVKTGLSTSNVDCSLRQLDGTSIMDIKGLRLTRYTGKAPSEPVTNPFLERHPTLRVRWKPDILRLPPGAESELQKYIRSFSALQTADVRDNQLNVIIAALLDLAGHKTPRMRVLELRDGCECIAKQSTLLLGKETAFPQYQSWHTGQLSEDGQVLIEDAGKDVDSFDVILIARHSTSQQIMTHDPKPLFSLLSEKGLIVMRNSENAVAQIKSANLDVLELENETILALPIQETRFENRAAVIIVKPDSSSKTTKFSKFLHQYLEGKARSTTTIPLGDIGNITLAPETICISLLELETEFLATMDAEDMNRLRKMTDTVTSLIWLTGANLLSAPNPNLTLSSGLSRALMLEQPSLRFSLVDCGDADLSQTTDSKATCENILRALTVRHAFDDSEFIQRGQMLHVSRFVPDYDLNTLFQRRLEGSSDPLEKTPLKDMGPARLSIGQVGMTDTIRFQQESEPSSETPPGHVDIDLRAVSLNAKDVYALSGRVETKNATLALDFGGIVSAVGKNVTHLKPGDRVAVFRPHHFKTRERVPVNAVHKLLPTEEFPVMATLLTVYATAIIALRDKANLRPGETILIHAGTGAFGLAAIVLAQSMGAIVYTTCGSQPKRDFLIQEMGFSEDQIFNSRDTSFVDGIKRATGRGVDVIVNSLVGDLMHESWACLAPFGRFIEVGKRELVDAGKLDMSIFLRNTTFTAFDLSEFFFADDPFYRNYISRVTGQVLELYRAGKIRPPPIHTFDVADISQAYRFFNNKARVGKVVVSMENPHSLVTVAPAKFSSVFDPVKSYLLVGCLGGLGRSLSRWMVSRGARKFVFLGRSGCDKPAAAQLVSRLRNSGSQVKVVRGDVSNLAHVQEAVSASAALGPIGGVVQAAMGLRESLFTSMSNEAWHTGIQPKWTGTWNIHNALEANDDALDFFLMTSSISGSLGTATESNYCAANSFLDSFARFRRSQGKPGVSLGLGMISEVGYLHENPEIEALLLRKGIQPLNEDELLQVIDFGLSAAGGEYQLKGIDKDKAADKAHILTGLEPLSARKLMSQGFDVSSGTLEDPRTALLAASLLAEKDARNASQQGSDMDRSATTAAEWFKSVPAAAAPIFASVADAPSLVDATLRLIKKRFSSLILMVVDEIDNNKALLSFGVDSMLAAEFRTWIFNTFRVDVPYLDIVSPSKTLSVLAEFIGDKLVGTW